jgi:hypothetical protein
MHAAGVLGDVAADRAGDLAARIGRVVQTIRRRGLADRQIAHAALHDRRARERVDGLRILLNFASDSVTPSRCGRSAPPDSPVPAPRATIGTRSA